MVCNTNIKEIDNDPENNKALIPILKEALDHINEFEKSDEGLVYVDDKVKVIVKRHDDHIPIFNINQWGYGKIYFYVPYHVRNVKAYLKREIEKEIKRIRRLYQEFCEGEKDGEG